jgi:hypothetical protein
METRPEIVGAPLEPVDLEFRLSDGFLTADLPNGARPAGTSRHMLDALHGLVLWDHLKSHSDWPMVHGATFIVDGKRLLLVGDKGQGKSTLALHLLLGGHRIEGDEHLSVGEATVVVRPRTLRIKPGSLVLLNAPSLLRDAPSIDTWDGIPVYAVDPSRFGQPWRIEEGPLDACIVIDANHGGRSICRPISADACFRALMSHGYFGPSNIVRLTARLRRLAAQTRAYSLHLGSLNEAEWHLKSVAAA